MCTIAAVVLNLFHPGYFLEDSAAHAAEQESVRSQAQEKTEGYSMMADSPLIYPPPPKLGFVACTRCACQDDSRSWI